jgi:hypothetical protein
MDVITGGVSSNQAASYDHDARHGYFNVHDDGKVARSSSLFNDHDESSIKQIQVGETSAKEIQDRRYQDLVLDYQQLKLKLQGTDDVVATFIARNAELSQDRAATDESHADECFELLET